MSEVGAHRPIEAVISEQPLSEREKDLVREVYERLAVFERGCAEYHSRARDARQIILLQDPYQDEVATDEFGNPIPTNQPRKKIMQVQTLKSTYVNSVADQMDNMPEANMIPETPEMQETAEDLTDVVRFVLNHNDYEALHRRRVEDFLGPGTAVTQVVWDSDMDWGRGNIALIRWPVENFLWDPLCEDIQDSRALIKVSWHPMSWFHAHYPKQAPYISAEDNQHNGVGVPRSQMGGEDGDEGRAMLLEYWYRRFSTKTRRYTINVAYLAGGALLANKERVFAHGRYPFVLDVMTPIEGMPVGDGMIHELAPMMRYINRYISYLDENIRMSSGAKLLIDERSGVDPDDMADMSKRVVTAKNMSDYVPQWLQTVPLTSAATGQLLQLQTDLKQDSGQNQFSRGETTGGVTAFSAIDALQAAAAKITRFRLATLNHGFKQIVELVMWLLSEFYDETRTRMITGKDGAQRPVDMSAERLFGISGGGALPPPAYSVQVQVQRRNPLRVQAMNETIIRAYSMAAQGGQYFPLSILFSMMDFDGKDRILPMLEGLEQQQSAMQQLAAENEQLKQGVSNLQEVNQQMSRAMGAAPDLAVDNLPMTDQAAATL